MEFTNPGLIPDPRSPIDKEKDYQHEEVAMSVPLRWNRTIDDAPVYSLRDQNGSGSCVPQGGAKALETITKVVASAHPPYRRRANFPGPGMWLQNFGEIIRRQGTTTEELDPSQRMTEQQMNADVTVSTPINGFLYAFPNVKNIDKIAEAIELQNHCMITIHGTMEEYANSEKPVVIPSDNLNCSHCICGVYYFTDENGVKCILADESWGPAYIKRRILTEDYLRARGSGAMYLIPPVVPVPKPKPKYTFTNVMLFGQSNYSIKMLQDILKYENLFPENVPSTSYYGSITSKWVLQWQKNHQVASLEELNGLGGKRAGAKTIAKLNSIYS